MIQYKRRETVTINVGGVKMGSGYPIRVQSMTNTDTADVAASAEQCRRIAQAGGEIVRLTAQGVLQANAIGEIRKLLRAQGEDVPLVADIHFNPRAAFAAAQVTDGVRINPGNFVDPARQFKKLEYTSDEYKCELQRIHDALVPFINVCREYGTAVRLGVNHGSLSDRIMSRYGNSAAGMVESVMEFLRVFVEQQFFNVVISMKASNVKVMVESVRRLIAAMDAEDMHFPLHLGVTEAGFGDDGRIKSAVGIGTLLSEGLGDTIRVSLSEDPVAEIPVARKIVEYIALNQRATPCEGEPSKGYDALMPKRRATHAVAGGIGGKHVPVVIATLQPSDVAGNQHKPDFYFVNGQAPCDGKHKFIVPAKHWQGRDGEYPLYTLSDWNEHDQSPIKFLQVSTSVDAARLRSLNLPASTVLVAVPAAAASVPAQVQALAFRLDAAGLDFPIIMRCSYDDDSAEWLQVKAGIDCGTVTMNGMADGLWLEAPRYAGSSCDTVDWQFSVLQAARARMSSTEFISCPSCGRTMFDLQTTVHRVRQATAHLTKLKIAVMGCVVNGPGEMADADYGYVGAARGRISLYKGKQCVERNIPEDEAIPHLVALIKANGDWVEP